MLLKRLRTIQSSYSITGESGQPGVPSFAPVLPVQGSAVHTNAAGVSQPALGRAGFSPRKHCAELDYQQ